MKSSQFLVYLSAKRSLMMAACAYEENPTEGQAYVLRVAARAFAKLRVQAKVETPIAEEP